MYNNQSLSNPLAKFIAEGFLRALYATFLLGAVALITACGGAGSPGPSPLSTTPPPVVSGISPTNGLIAGGTIVTITGANFLGATGVTIGGSPATNVIVNSATQITATTPVGVAGVAAVSVTTASGAGISGVTFTYGATAGAVPSIAAISPTNGTTAGGTVVTLTGTNFTGATGVTFNGTAGTGFVVNSDTQITVTSPSGSAGAINIVVLSPNGAGTATNIYTYVTAPSTAPTITSISPSSGTTAGGTSVTVTGTNLTGATGITFDGNAGTALVVNSNTQLTATTPAGTVGAKVVVVTTPAGTGTLQAGFSYVTSLGVPTITLVAPNTGATSGGTVVTITGTNFAGGATVTFGGVAGSGVNVVSATQITVVTPAGTAGAKNVVVTTSGGSATSTGGFTYVMSPISTFAGTTAGYSGDGAVATAAQLSSPRQIAFDTNGNLYFADTANHVIRAVCKTTGTYFGVAMTAGNVYTVAGTTVGSTGDGAAAIAAKLSSPVGVAFDTNGNLFIADSGNARIRVVAKTAGTYFGVAMTANFIHTVAGTGATGATGDGAAALAALLDTPTGVAFDAAGNLYIADSGNHRIRAVNTVPGTYFNVAMTANNIYAVAGTGAAGSTGDGAAATAALLNTPRKVAFDTTGNLFIADSANNRIRVVNKTAGTYFGVAMTVNNIYVVAGTTAGLSGDGAAATAAQLSAPSDIAFDATGNLYIADTGNSRIRAVNTAAGTYFGVVMTVNNIYTVAGTTAGTSGDGAVATAAQINLPQGVAFDASGNMYIGDSTSNRIRMVAP